MSVTMTYESAVQTAEPKNDSHEPIITFSSCSDSFCIGIVDIVNSSKISARLTQQQTCQYYSIFLNTMAGIVQRHNGTVVKNIGDCLLYYFPESSKREKESLINALECGVDMLLSHEMINDALGAIDLPKLDYRISLDFGSVMIARSPTSYENDIFGPTVNLCSKINHAAKPNGMVIGNDLYEMTHRFPGYKFNEVSSFSSGLKNNYPVYAVKKSVKGVWFTKPLIVKN